MTICKLVGTVPLGPTLGTLPQLGDDVRDGITADVDGVEVTISFAPAPTSGYLFMPSTLIATVGCSDDGTPSRHRAFELLIEVTQNVLDMIRVTQPTTGLPGTLPNFDGVRFYRDGHVEPLGFDWYSDYRPLAMILTTPGRQPHADDFRRSIQRDLNADWDLDILIAQARHYAQNNWDSNPALSLFLAALVVETKMKRVLWRDTPSDTQDALLLVVPKQKALKHDVLSLFSSIAEEFLGRSLKKERPTLWAGVQKIFERRNQFAHRATPIARDEAKDAVTCARRVLLWADQSAPQNYPH